MKKPEIDPDFTQRYVGLVRHYHLVEKIPFGEALLKAQKAVLNTIHMRKKLKKEKPVP
jgi:hypothetical protein